MENIILVVAIIMFIVSFVSYRAEIKGCTALENMVKTYGKGINLGITSQDELYKLANEALGPGMQVQKNPDMSVSVKGIKHIHRLYIEDNLVKIKYPSTYRGIGQITRAIKSLELMGKLKVASEASNIMDAMIKKVNPENVTDSFEREIQVNKIAKSFWRSLTVGMVCLVILFLYYV